MSPRGLPLSYIKKWGISKLAWRKFRAGALTKGVPTRTAAIKRRLRGKNPMVRRRRRYFGRPFRRRSRRGGMTIPIAPIIGIIAAPAMSNAINNAFHGNFPEAITNLKGFVGFARDTFDPEDMIRNWTPVIAGLLIHKFVGGRPLNLNAALGRAKVPLIRI